MVGCVISPTPTRAPRRGPSGAPSRHPEGFGSRSRPLALVALACCLLLLGPGCTNRPRSQEPPRPSAYRVEVKGLAEIGPYLQADLAGRIVDRDGSFRHFYFPRTPECQRALTSTGEVQYRPEGSFGLLKSAEGDRCHPVGIGSLPAWRDHRGTLRNQPLPARVQAEYEPIAAGETQLLVRGRFPLALELRWPEPMDTIAVLPVSDACQSIFASHEATMEYRTKGEQVFWLEGDAGRCPIVGLAVPVEDGSESLGHVGAGPEQGDESQ